MTWQVGDSSGGMIFTMPIVKESECNENFWGLQRMLKRVSGDRYGMSVKITLGCLRRMGNLLLIRRRCPLLLGEMYLFQPLLWLCLFVCLGIWRPEVSLWFVSDLMLYLIHDEIFIINLIPLFCQLYFLWILLAPSDTTITANEL